MNEKLLIPLNQTTTTIMSNINAWLMAENLSRNELVRRLNAFAEENGGTPTWSDTKMSRLFADTSSLKDSEIVSLSVVTGIPLSDLIPSAVEGEDEELKVDPGDESEALSYREGLYEDIRRLVARLDYLTHEMSVFSASNPAELEIEVYKKLRDYINLLDLYVEDQTNWYSLPIPYTED